MVDWSQILQGCWLRICKIVQSTQISILIDEITLLLKEQALLKQLNTCMQKNSGSSKSLEENCMIWRYIYSKKIKNSKFFRWSSSKRCFLLLKLKTKLKLSNQIFVIYKILRQSLKKHLFSKFRLAASRHNCFSGNSVFVPIACIHTSFFVLFFPEVFWNLMSAFSSYWK